MEIDNPLYTLSGDDLKKQILSATAEDALEIILDSPSPATLVQSFSEEDLFWLVQSIGPRDALPILARASNKQWRYMVDLQVWGRDRLNMDSVHSWFSLLLSADTERFLNWGFREQPEITYLYLFKNIEVKIREEDQSLSDFNDDFFTLDGVFFVRVLNQGHEAFVRNFLERLASHNLDFYHALLLNIRGVLADALEEEGYHFRSVRLAEKGFLPFEEAIGVYQYLNIQTVTEKRYKITRKKDKTSQPLTNMTYFLPSIAGDSLFVSYIRKINSPETIERLQCELAGLCNQILSADLQVVNDREVLKQAIQKAGGYLSIGLDLLDQGDPATRTDILDRYPLNLIFRLGYGQALERKWHAEKWLKDAWFKDAGLEISFWGQRWEGLLTGLGEKRPLFYTGLAEKEYREFESPDDIAHWDRGLEQIRNLDRLFAAIFANRVPTWAVAANDLTWKSLLLTLWARRESGMPITPEPVTTEEIKPWFQNLWVNKGGVPRIRRETKTSFLGWLANYTGPEDDILNGLANTFEELFEELEGEYRLVQAEDLDPKFVRLFRLKGRGNK
jgi:hypothetical protein